MKNKLNRRLRSFGYAFNGLIIFFKTQVHAWIHLSATIIAIVMGWLFNISVTEWCLIVFAIGLVFIAEVINTALEFLVDKVSPDYDEQAGKVKDLAAAAVLVASIIALIIAAVIFIPKFY
jgi:diacylglycerol kinase